MIEMFIEDLNNWLQLLKKEEDKKLFKNMQGDLSFYKYYNSYITELKLIKCTKNKNSQIFELKKILEGIKRNIKRKIPENIKNKWISINL